MGRTQSFDTTEVVRAARTLFWQKGYEETSVPELESATKITRSSIYHAFTSKRGLFDAAIDSYLTEVVRPRLRPLQEGRVEPGALTTYLQGLRTAMAQKTMIAENGCLLINTAGATLAHEQAVQRVIAAYRRELSDAVKAGLAAQGTMDADGHSSRAITALIISAFALARTDHEAALENLDTALAMTKGMRS